jgi:hypothetical protein
MHAISALIIQRLVQLGVAKPTPQLIVAVQVQLAPRVAALVARAVTKPLVSRAFASILVEAKGSPEGSVEDDPARASSDLIVRQDKPNHVAGATHPEAV